MRVRVAAVAVCLGLCGMLVPLRAGVGPDCNGNLVPDDSDIGDGTSADCNANGLPDECELGPSQCPEPGRCIFGAGVVEALGAVQLALEPLPDGGDPDNGLGGSLLKILGIGPSGEDGVLYRLQSGLTKVLRFELPNLSSYGTGAFLRFEQRLIGAGGDVNAALSMLHEGDRVRFRSEVVGAASGLRLLVFQGDALVAEVAELEGGEFWTAPVDLASFVCDLGCSIGLLDGAACVPGENCPAEACLGGVKIVVRFATQTLIALPQSGGVIGDRFVLHGPELGPLPAEGAALTLLAANTGDLGLLAEDLVETLPDCNQNGIIDACELEAELSPDCDSNGVPDACDIAEGRLRDCDQNGAADACQIEAGIVDDCNANGVPDRCDLTSGAAPDCNENELPDDCELAAGLVADCNGNGVPDGCELEIDGSDCNANGVLDACELTADLDCNASGVLDECELVAGELSDCDGNGTPDRCEVSAERDCDANGVLDACELASGAAADCNGNGVVDACEFAEGGDCDSNGVLDVCELFDEVGRDCNANGLPDACDVSAGRSLDCNRNGVPDECELKRGAIDCDANGVPDVCDLSAGDVEDCNQNGSPDRCDLASGEAADCNGNRIPDACDLAAGVELDCNQNGVPDSCDLSLLTSADCNQNGVPDTCDIASGTSADEDGDGVPDDCGEPNEVPARLAFEAALVSAQQLRATGIIPQETVDFLLSRESDLAEKQDDLLDALRVVDFREAGTLGGGGDGGGAAGGVVSGGTWLAVSATGLVVGRMRVDLSWNNNHDICSSVVGGHSFVGGVIGGGCNSAQVGALFGDPCVATRSCGSLVVECGTYQLQCQQVIGAVTIQFNTPLESICAACPEIPWQLPGDCNQDGEIDIGDASCLFGFLFLGNPDLLPCGDGAATAEANKTLMDWNGDGVVDMSDGVSTLTWLFNQSVSGGGAPHALGRSCTIIAECSDACFR